jgi:hypothetical protein
MVLLASIVKQTISKTRIQSSTFSFELLNGFNSKFAPLLVFVDDKRSLIIKIGK